MPKNKRTIGFLIIVFLLLFITISIVINRENVKEILNADDRYLQGETEISEIAETSGTINGDSAIVSSTNIIQRKTGTGPFDSDDEAGNDSSEDNDIVRSFDEISWTINCNMAIKDGQTITSVKGGYLNIEIALPETLANLVKWNTDAMTWTEGTQQINEDGTVFSAKYHMNENEVTVPGTQSLNISLDVLGAANGTEIIPEFKLWLEGNSDSEKYTFTDNAIKISAVPKYNIQLQRQTTLYKKVTVNYDDNDHEGRMYGYTVTLQLYNDNEEKGIKGIEYPKGEIQFDIDLKLEKTASSAGTREDITDDCTPILWNYKINSSVYGGNISDREMNFVSGSMATGKTPYGTITSNRTESIYDSGNIYMEQNGGKISTTISNYDFDGVFPIYNYEYSGYVHSSVDYAENIGCFSAGYMQIFVPFEDEDMVNNYQYYLSVSDSNFTATSMSEQKVSEQIVTSDDSLNNLRVYLADSKSIYGQSIALYSNGKILASNAGQEDAAAYLGQSIELYTKFTSNPNNESSAYTANKLIKFDGEAVEPVLYSDGAKYKKSAFNGDMEFNVWYLTKKDGTNWTNQEEMNTTNIEALEIYEKIEEIPEGKICIGEYLESTEGELSTTSANNNIVRISLNIKDSAKVNTTYAFVQRTWVWDDKLDRSIYTVKNLGNFTYPTADYDSKDPNYIKAEYDEDGNIISKSDTRTTGTTLLILGAKQSITVESIDETTNELKEYYDLGKNESEVIYKLTPNLQKYASNSPTITGVTIKVTDTLPVGLTYVGGSEQNGNEPDIINNEDGTQTLIWYIYDCTVGDKIDSIIFKANINEETANATTLTNTAVISADKDKVGNEKLATRTTTNTIQVTNLASHRLYKTTDAPVVESGETIHYQIVYQNKTDEKVEDFQLLDILPYNGDSRGSSISGTYHLDRIQISQANATTGNVIENDNLSLYITKDTSARTDITVKNSDIGTSDIWEEKTIGSTIGEEVVAYALKGEIEVQEKVIIDLYLTPENNESEDTYVNSVTAQIYKDSDELTTNIISVTVVKRLIDGYVWFDENADGMINENENYLSGIEVTLLNSDGTTAKDVNGQEITSVRTDTKGYYKFENMAKGDYIVKVSLPDSNYEFTEKEVGTNQEINSKINSDGTTDIITKLNSVQSPELKETYINAGIKLKDTSVMIHYYLEGTTTKLSEDVIIAGRVGDTYNTTSASDIASKYELVKTPTNVTGIMTEEQIVVIYYYRLKDTSVLVHHYIEGTTTPLSSDVTIAGKVDDTYSTTVASDIPSKYELVETPTNATGIMTEEQIVVTYYYHLKDTRVIVKYLEKGTDAVLAEEEVINGKVDDKYNTTKKTIQNYTYIEDTGNTTGVMTENAIEVIYYYLQNAKVTVQHIDKITGQKLTPDDVISGLVGDEYTTNSKEIKDYILVEEPAVKAGIMQKNEIVLTYYYVHVSGGVIEKHIDVTSGEVLYNEIHEGKKGEPYDIPSKTFAGYDLVETRLPTNSSGTMEINTIEVKYYYIKKAEITVKYIDKITGNELTQSIVLNGHEGDTYTTENKTFENYDLVKLPENNSGNMPGGKTTITYEYVHISAGVVERHYDINTNQLLEPEKKHTGHQGDSYTIEAKEFAGYDLVESKSPQNASGTMTIEEIEVNYYYAYQSSVLVKYIDKTTGKEIETKTIHGHEGDSYTTEAKEFTGYDLIEEEIPVNKEGKMTRDETTVIYYYIRTAEVEVKYIDRTTKKEIAEKEMISGHENDKYTTEAKDISYYKLVDQTNNTEGTMKVEVIKQEDGTEVVNAKTIVEYYYEPLEFNLKVEKTITKIIVDGQEKNVTNGELEKVEINRKKLMEETVKIEYLLKVINDGELAGQATLIDNIPEGFEMTSEENNGWTVKNGTSEIKIDNIEAGEEKEYKVVLQWQKGESNTGTKENVAYISGIQNEAGFKETTEEDNKDGATVIISIATGENRIISIVIASIIMSMLISGVLILQGETKTKRDDE